MRGGAGSVIGVERERREELTISLDCPPAENITNLRLTNWG